jgi:hypothetical protein
LTGGEPLVKTLLITTAALALTGLGYQLLSVAISATRTTQAVLATVGQSW